MQSFPCWKNCSFAATISAGLAEDWGDAPAIIGTSCLFIFAHRQYLIPNAYSITMVASLFCLALGLGIVFAYTRSLVPSMVAHAIINIPMTPRWQAILLILFLVGLVIAFRKGSYRAIAQVFRRAPLVLCILLAIACSLYVIASQHFAYLTWIAIALLIVAIALECLSPSHRTVSSP